jgi:hypothetical protein
MHLCNGLNIRHVIKHCVWYSPFICLYMCVIDSWAHIWFTSRFVHTYGLHLDLSLNLGVTNLLIQIEPRVAPFSLQRSLPVHYSEYKKERDDVEAKSSKYY